MKKNSRVSPKARERIAAVAAAKHERWKKYHEDAAQQLIRCTQPNGVVVPTIPLTPYIVSEEYTRNLLRAALMIKGSDRAWGLVEEALQNLITYKTVLGKE